MRRKENEIDLGAFPTLKWLQLVIVGLAVFLSSLDVTVNVALPAISQHFVSEPRVVYLMITFYLGTTVGLQMGVGSAGDHFGLRRVFFVGLFAYTIAMVAIGLSPTIEWVIGFRILQAVGNAILLAISPALANSLFPEFMRGRALGIMTAVGTAGMIVGTLSAGLMLETFSWHWIFLGRIPVCILAIAGTWIFLGEVGQKPISVCSVRVYQNQSASDCEDTPLKTFDLIGACLIFFTVISIVLFLNIGSSLGWIGVGQLGTLSLASALGFSFIRRQSRIKFPLLDLGILANPVVIAGISSNFFLNMGTFVNIFILPYFVHEIMGVSTVTLGIFLLLSSLGISIFAPVGGYISDRFGTGPVAVAGIMIVAIGISSYTTLTSQATITEVGVRMGVVGAGMGMFQSSNLSLIMGKMRLENLGTGGALSSISRGMGCVSAVALMGGLFAAIYTANSAGVDMLFASSNGESSAAYVSAFKTVYSAAAVVTILGLVTSILAWLFDR